MSYHNSNILDMNQLLPNKSQPNKAVAVAAPRDQKYVNIWSSQNSSPAVKTQQTQDAINQQLILQIKNQSKDIAKLTIPLKTSQRIDFGVLNNPDYPAADPSQRIGGFGSHLTNKFSSIQ